MISKLEAVLAVLALTVTLAAAGCDESSEPCPAGSCRVYTPPPGSRTPLPVPRCITVCANLMGECDGTASSDSDSDLASCQRQCPANFTDRELDCLSALTCGASTDACLP